MMHFNTRKQLEDLQILLSLAKFVRENDQRTRNAALYQILERSGYVPNKEQCTGATLIVDDHGSRVMFPFTYIDRETTWEPTETVGHFFASINDAGEVTGDY